MALSLAPAPAAERLRVATFNVLLAQNPQGQLAVTLNNPNATNPRRIAEIIQRVAPDVILLNEFDYDAAGLAADRFQANFLSVGQNGQAPIDFPYRFLAPSNTGEHSGYDLDNNGVTDSTVGDAGYAGDAFGFGEFPGKFGMLVLSKYPIVSDRARTFRLLRWKDMPGARIPPGYYSPEELEVFRVSSKSHWDVPIDVDGTLVHLLAHHPTPPIFDGPEDRNGRRNHDEIRLWADYLSVDTGGYIVDDAGTPGGLVPGERFVIVGDHNADPTRGDSLDFAINQLLLHPAVNADFIPRRTGMPVGPNSDLTADFAGQDLRVDYVLPSRAGFSILGGAVFWPAAGEPGAALISASDHRLVYLDLEIEPITGRAEDLGIERENGVVALTWRYEQGVVYSVENSPRLVAGSWEEVEGIAIIVDAEAGTASATIVDPAMRAHFFRVISRPE
ncbi:MAG TPA: endonuclease/exonuclease/phosphatase family protein [Methylomirabilota bacterium]|nr:endonuclease/exonuclease/phosphatase family protein [Methylomirabilota bacterium]